MIGVISAFRIAFTLRLTISFGLAEQLATLAVAGDHVRHIEFGQHLGRHFAGVGAAALPVTVLGTERDRDLVCLEHCLHRSQIGERRVNRHVDRVDVVGIECVLSFCTS